MVLKLDVNCSICGTPFKCDPRFFNNPKCFQCLQNKTSISKKTLADTIKNQKRGFQVRAEITTDAAIMNALMANANAFRAIGGSPMMFTEHVENGIDAIKILHAWKSTDTPKKLGDIRIIFDDKKSQVLVIDNGTGFEDPIWILNNPLRSRKTSVSLEQTGKYGRGLQGFRGFCESLQYFTLRSSPHETEVKRPENEGLTINELKCTQLKLVRDSIYGDVIPNQLDSFTKYTNSQTGTVAIFSDWIEDEYQNLKRKKKELYERIQHHFRHDLEIGLVKLSIQDGKKIHEIIPRQFSNENGDFDLYDLPDQDVFDEQGKKIGTIEYFLYKTSGEYKHNYKPPFLLAKDNRPLQDSFIATMPQMSQYAGVWKSPYLTGYIKCNFVEPDNLRVALSIEDDNEQKNKAFFERLRADSITLKKLISEFQSTFIRKEQTEENKNIILEIQSFLNTQKIELDLPDLTKLGILKPGEEGTSNQGSSISDLPGKRNQGRIVPNGPDEIVVFYEKAEKGPKKKPTGEIKPRKKTRLRVTVPTKDGRNTTTMLMDPKLLSKDGRRRKQNPKGVNLITTDEGINPEMSWYDENDMAVNVNLEHENYEKLEALKKKSITERTNVYSIKEKNYIRRCYLWELMDTFYKETDDGIDKYEKFWDLFHKFFLHKDTS